jgi:hypothetical protein
MESVTVAFRLKYDDWIRHSEDAQRRGMALGSYLRFRLEERDQLAAEVAQLRTLLLAVGPHPGPEAEKSQPIPPETFLEMLLMLRALAGPQKALMAEKEVERLGIESWKF